MYNLHYDDPHRRVEYFLSCDRLALNITEWARPRGRAAGSAADLRVGALWAAAERLQWALSSERAIDGDSVTATLAGLSAAGTLEDTRSAFCRLIAAVAVACPSLRQTPRATLAQLVAFGRGAVMAGLESPDFFEFLKNELQGVDLAAALRL